MTVNPKVETLIKYKEILYDYFFDNQIDWPCITCKWGSIVSQNADFIKQKIYFALRTDGLYNEQENTWKKFPSSLIVANVDFPKEGKRFHDELNHIYTQHNLKKCPHITVKQMIVHPGDPSIMKKSKNNQKLIATKSDQNCVYVWDLDKHKYLPQLKENGSKADIPDLTLIGHESSSVFALDWSLVGYRLASGGKDKKVLIWDIEDYQAKLAFSQLQAGKRELNSITSMDQNVQLSPIFCLEGHTQNIEDVCFHPTDKNILASASDDQTVIGWDVRSQNNKAFIIDNIHSNDINCIDWCVCNSNYLATGSQDKSVCIMDLRIQKELHRIKVENSNLTQSQLGAVECIKFSPFSQDIIAIGSDNLRFYNLSFSGPLKPIFTQLSPKGNVADFDWNLENDWSILSTYQDGENEYDSGGGYLHVFRPLRILRQGKEEDRTKLNEFVKQKEYKK